MALRHKAQFDWCRTERAFVTPHLSYSNIRTRPQQKMHVQFTNPIRTVGRNTKRFIPNLFKKKTKRLAHTQSTSADWASRLITEINFLFKFEVLRLTLQMELT